MTTESQSQQDQATNRCAFLCVHAELERCRGELCGFMGLALGLTGISVKKWSYTAMHMYMHLNLTYSSRASKWLAWEDKC